MSDCPILITGGLGAIGSFATRRFVETGYRPVVYDWRGDPTLIDDLSNDVQLLRGDVLDFPALARAVRQYGIRRIVHLAALMPPAAQENPPLGWRVNAGGTLNILELARTYEIERIVFASSKAVYGPVGDKEAHPHYKPVTEEHRKEPESVYGVTKLASELMGQQYRRNYGLQFVAVRFAATYGPGKLERHGTVGLTSQIIEQAMAGMPVRIARGGDQQDDMVYNRDVGLGVFLAATAKEVPSAAYNIGTGRLSNPNQVAGVLRELFPGTSIEVEGGLDYYGTGSRGYCRFDISRARRELGYEPQYDLAHGIEDYLHLMRRLGLQPTASNLS